MKKKYLDLTVMVGFGCCYWFLGWFVWVFWRLEVVVGIFRAVFHFLLLERGDLNFREVVGWDWIDLGSRKGKSKKIKMGHILIFLGCVEIFI